MCSVGILRIVYYFSVLWIEHMSLRHRLVQSHEMHREIYINYDKQKYVQLCIRTRKHKTTDVSHMFIFKLVRMYGMPANCVYLYLWIMYWCWFVWCGRFVCLLLRCIVSYLCAICVPGLNGIEANIRSTRHATLWFGVLVNNRKACNLFVVRLRCVDIAMSTWVRVCMCACDWWPLLATSSARTHRRSSRAFCSAIICGSSKHIAWVVHSKRYAYSGTGDTFSACIQRKKAIG